MTINAECVFEPYDDLQCQCQVCFHVVLCVADCRCKRNCDGSGDRGHLGGVGVAPPTHGPGTELSKLLTRIGIEPTPTCACRAKQQEMDLWGCDEASKPERIEEVVKVMREEAAARGLPFFDVAGRLLVKRAIANARRNA